MRDKHNFLQIILVVIVWGAVLCLFNFVKPVSAKPPYQSDGIAGKCKAIFGQTLDRISLPVREYGSSEWDGWKCLLLTTHYKDGSSTTTDEINFGIYYNPEAQPDLNQFVALGKSRNKGISPLLGGYETTTFHGYPAIRLLPIQDSGVHALGWHVPEQELSFYVFTYLMPQALTEEELTQLAETFYEVVYEQVPELGLNSPDQEMEQSEIAPETPLEEYNEPWDTEQLDIPAFEGQTDSLETDFSIPPLVIGGSVAVPIAGAILGTILGTLVTLLGNAATSAAQSASVSTAADAASAATQAGAPDLVWSERPWDEAGPGYVTREEYERTKWYLEHGYRWDKRHGWVEPGQVEQFEQWQQTDREAVKRETEEFRRKLQESQPREDSQQDLRTEEMRLVDMKEDLYALRDQIEKTHYVLNPWQGDPTLVIHRGITLFNLAYDTTIGKITGESGLTCGDFVEKTSQEVHQIVQKHFKGAKVESMVFEERSSLPENKSLRNFLDRVVEDNHNLIRITLPDGSQLAIDFHQNLHPTKRAPLIRKWDEVRQEWREYLGEHEFVERVSYTLEGQK